MMKCPHCDKQIGFEPPVLRNVESYGNSQIAKTSCCGKGVTVYPQMTYIIEKYEGEKKEDNWGNKFIV